MFSLNSIPAPPAAENLRPFFDLLGLLSDPAAAKERLETFAASSEELRNLIAQAKTAQADLAAAQSEHEQAIAKASASAAVELDAKKAELEGELLRRENALAARDKRLAKSEAALADERLVVEGMKSDLERRLRLLAAAASAA